MGYANTLSRVGVPLQIFGKLLLALLFWWDAIFQFIPNFADVVAYIGQNNLPYPNLVAASTTGFLIVTPILFFIKRVEVISFLALGAFCLMTSLIFHPYWIFTMEDRAGEQIHFMKDFALAGAMFTVAGMKLRAMG